MRFGTHRADALLIVSCLAAAACSTVGGTRPDPPVAADRVITNEELDEVPEWAIPLEARCFVGDADACVEVANNESPEARARRREAKKKTQRCEAEWNNHRWSGGPLSQKCIDQLKLHTPREALEERVIDEEEAARERFAQRFDLARKNRWYHRALAARLRLCSDGTPAASECRDKATNDLSFYIGSPLTVERRAAFDAEVAHHRVLMKDACIQGGSSSCWDWFTTHEVDEDATPSGRLDVLMRAVAFGSPDAWAFIRDTIATQEPPGADPKRLAAAKKRRRKMSSARLDDNLFGASEGLLAGFGSVPRLVRIACESGDMGACYADVSPSIWRSGVGDPLHDRKARRVHASAHERCASKKKDARACWVAGYVAHRHGVGVDEATASYERGCALGEARACEGMGVMLFEQGDEAGAAPWLQRSCGSSSPRGCALLGLMTATGRGVTRDLARARELLAKACASTDETSDDRAVVCRPLQHSEP